MNVREALYADVPRLIEMGKCFYEQTGFARSMPFDETSARITVSLMMQGDGACIFVALNDQSAIVGMIGGVLNLNPYSMDYRVAEEKFWYVDPEGRNGTAGPRLKLAFEEWARQNRASAICMAAIKGEYELRVSEMYEKRGYVHLEAHYVKEVKQHASI